MRISKKAILMWVASYMLKPVGIAVLISWFAIGNLYLYTAPRNLGDFLGNIVVLGGWLFLGLSIILAFLIFEFCIVILIFDICYLIFEFILSPSLSPPPQCLIP